MSGGCGKKCCRDSAKGTKKNQATTSASCCGFMIHRTGREDFYIGPRRDWPPERREAILKSHYKNYWGPRIKKQNLRRRRVSYLSFHLSCHCVKKKLVLWKIMINLSLITHTQIKLVYLLLGTAFSKKSLQGEVRRGNGLHCVKGF